MKFRLFILALLLGAAAIIVGVDRGPDALRVAGIQPPATTQPIVIAPVADHELVTTGAPVEPSDQTTWVSGSVLTVDGHLKTFGPAMIRLSKTGDKITARLYSDDPQGVLTGEPANSYDFNMELPTITDPANIGQAVWTYKSPSSDKQNSPYGIFLNKEQKLLQPMDVRVAFSGQAPNIMVDIHGVFWLYQTTGDFLSPTPAMVRVSGTLSAVVPGK